MIEQKNLAKIIGKKGIPRILLLLTSEKRFRDLQKDISMSKATLVNQLKYLKEEKFIRVKTGGGTHHYSLTDKGKETVNFLRELQPTAAQIGAEIRGCITTMEKVDLQTHKSSNKQVTGSCLQNVLFDLINIKKTTNEKTLYLHNVPYLFSECHTNILFGESPSHKELEENPEKCSKTAGISDAYGIIELAGWLRKFIGAPYNITSLSSSWLKNPKRELANANLVIVGSPKINAMFHDLLTEGLSLQMGFKFRLKNPEIITSSKTEKDYENQDYGVIDLMSNPYDDRYCCLVVFGPRWTGTWASSVLLPRKYSEIKDVTTCIVKASKSEKSNYCDDVQILEKYDKYEYQIKRKNSLRSNESEIF
jgi:DNA-binding HxlR family transcriptional regulator